MLLLYAYFFGIPSSRRIERVCWKHADFRVLTGNQQPDHTRISDFRFMHLDALAALFVQVLRRCQKAGLVTLGEGLSMEPRSWPMPPSTRPLATSGCSKPRLSWRRRSASCTVCSRRSHWRCDLSSQPSSSGG